MTFPPFLARGTFWFCSTKTTGVIALINVGQWKRIRTVKYVRSPWNKKIWLKRAWYKNELIMLSVKRNVIRFFQLHQYNHWWYRENFYLVPGLKINKFKPFYVWSILSEIITDDSKCPFIMGTSFHKSRCEVSDFSAEFGP